MKARLQNCSSEENAWDSKKSLIMTAGAVAGQRPRVFVAAENRLLIEALTRLLVKSVEIEVVGADIAEPFRTEDLLKEETDILLLSSRGNRNEDLTAVRTVRMA